MSQYASNSADYSKKSTAHPSLSRDFSLLVGAIMFLLLLLAAWVTWVTYTNQSQQIEAELAKESERIDRVLEREIENTSYLLGAISKQIVQMKDNNLTNINQVLQTYASQSKLFALWSWVDTTQHVVVASGQGIMEQKVDVSDRDYVIKSQADPWQVIIGTPIQGRVSKRWIIPVAMAITDSSGKVTGTINASIDVQMLTNQIKMFVLRDGVSFAILSKNMVPLTEVSEDNKFMATYFPQEKLQAISEDKAHHGVMSRGRLFSNKDIYSYYRISEKNPYVIVVGYNLEHSTAQLRGILYPRIIQIVALAGFLLIFLSVVRVRVISPLLALTQATAAVARGEEFVRPQNPGPQELETLADRVSDMRRYIHERQQVEQELRSKIETLIVQHGAHEEPKA